jgi:hypothetical protein
MENGICTILIHNSGRLHFMSSPFEEEIEITGHPSLTVTTSLSSRDGSKPREIDIFVTIHHYDNAEKEGKLPKIWNTFKMLIFMQYSTQALLVSQFRLSKAGFVCLDEPSQQTNPNSLKSQ